MTTYEVLLSDNRTVTMSGRDPLHACERAADLYGSPATAWRTPRVGIYVGGDGIIG